MKSNLLFPFAILCLPVSAAPPDDGSVLPFPPTPSASVAGPTLQESTHKRRLEPERLPKGAPNVLIVLIDDCGFGAASAFGGPCQTPVAERLAAFETFFQYAGRYHLQTVDGQQQVVHRVTHALNPNFVGTQQVRNVAFAGDGRLTLSASDTVPGTTVARHHRLVWQRNDVTITPAP